MGGNKEGPGKWYHNAGDEKERFLSSPCAGTFIVVTHMLTKRKVNAPEQDGITMWVTTRKVQKQNTK